jgi:hypothetical protein
MTDIWQPRYQQTEYQEGQNAALADRALKKQLDFSDPEHVARWAVASDDWKRGWSDEWQRLCA